MSWLSGYRRLTPRYERHPRNHLAFLGLAAALCCYKRLVRLTTQDTVLTFPTRGCPRSCRGERSPCAHTLRSNPEQPCPRPPAPNWKSDLKDAILPRTVLLVLGVLLRQLAFILPYVGAFHSPEPDAIPVAVVAPRLNAKQSVDQLNATTNESLSV
ncbi:hypothetical protein [Streptomyces sp. NPDC001100]